MSEHVTPEECRAEMDDLQASWRKCVKATADAINALRSKLAQATAELDEAREASDNGVDTTAARADVGGIVAHLLSLNRGVVNDEDVLKIMETVEGLCDAIDALRAKPPASVDTEAARRVATMIFPGDGYVDVSPESIEEAAGLLRRQADALDASRAECERLRQTLRMTLPMVDCWPATKLMIEDALAREEVRAHA